MTVAEGEAVDAELLAVLRELRGAGFEIALDDDARFEVLAHRPVDPAVAFTVGLFSILPALAGTTMEALVGGLPFDAPVSGALLEQDGEEGALLAGVLAFERGEFEACESFGIDLLEVAEVYRAALAWVEQSAPHLA